MAARSWISDIQGGGPRTTRIARLRYLWLSIGGAALAGGMLGTVVPLLPTTPLLLLAAWSFARASPRLHHWLVTHPRLVTPIEDWQRHGAIRPRAKLVAMFAVVASFVTSVLLGVSGEVLLVQAVVLAAVSLFILTRPDGTFPSAKRATARPRRDKDGP